jgi:membrane protease YdiL (CAAX protease family)
MKYGTSLPWAAVIMAAYLWLFWEYVRGKGWSPSTAHARRTSARANEVPGELWGPALIAGVLGLAGVLLLQGILSRMVTLPQQRADDLSRYPPLVVLLSVFMSAVVAGVVEEIAFRGYMQRPIEHRHGPVVAILVTGVIFGLMHFTHPEVTLVLLPYYAAVAAVYGTLAHLTDSTLPSMVLHAGGNMLGAFGLLARGRSEWQLSAAPPPLIWETGADAAFWGNVAGFVVVVLAATWAYRALAVAARNARTATA